MRRILRLAALTIPTLLLSDANAQLRSPSPSASTTTTAAPPAAGTLASAIDAAKKTDYARAETELAAIKGNDLSAALVVLARVQLEQGKLTEAEKTLNLALASPKRSDAVPLKARLLFGSGKREDAIKLLEKETSPANPANRESRLTLAEYRIAIGKRADAEPLLMGIIKEWNDDIITSKDAVGLSFAARAASLLRSPKDANKLFQDSGVADPNDTRMKLWWAEQFLDKFNLADAESLVKESLKIAPKLADALVLYARIKLEQSYDFEAGEDLVTEALAINPKHTGALAVRASIALHDMDIDKSDKAVAAGLAIDPNHLELWSLKAAGRFLADDTAGYESAKKETLTRNPEYSQFYDIVADPAEWEHRYDDIVKMMSEAVKIDKDDSKAWSKLGMMQMRGGDDANGLASLNTAWSKDHFNVYVFNTLELYDKYIAFDYDMVQEGAFKIRYPKNEEEVLKRYVPRMLGEAWASMKTRYGFVPTNPVQIELFGNPPPGKKMDARTQFAVRTSGLPSIGIQGVCFGRVVGSMSPGSEPFNWGNVIWHELGHVFAIQLSKSHVPRWFTEGLSEYETIARRVEWQREMDPQLYIAVAGNKLPSAVDMNRAFTHASDDLDVTQAYYAASQMLVFTVEQYGMPKVVDALKLWGTGLKTGDVIQKAFGVSAADYDKKFHDWAMARLDRYKGQFIPQHRAAKDPDEAARAVGKKPNDALAHLDLAIALLRKKKLPEAKKELETALKLDPGNAIVHWYAYQIARMDPTTKGDKKAAEMVQHLAAIQKANDGFVIRMALADIAEEKKDLVEEKKQLEAAYRFDPTQSEPLKGLYDMAHDDKRTGDELEILRKLAPLEQHDHDIWRLYLDALVANQQWDELVRAGDSALYVDVHRAGTHIAYARGLLETGDHVRAVFESESALLCLTAAGSKAKPQDGAMAHAIAAQSLAMLKRTAEAKKHLDEALKLDPTNELAKAVKL